MEQEKENSELLVPIGGSAYIKAKLGANDKVIIGLGAGVSVEKTLPEVKAIVKQRLDEMEKTSASAQQQLSQVAERISQGRSRMESLLATLREGQQ
jgi:prefoldin alpha subunit